MKQHIRIASAVLAFLLALCVCFTACDISLSDSQASTTEITSSTKGTEATTTTPLESTAPSTDETTGGTASLTTSATTSSATTATTQTTATSTTATSTTAPSTTVTGGTTNPNDNPQPPLEGFDLSTVPAFSGNPFFTVNSNIPFFTSEDITTEAYELYSELDELGRCTPAMACLGRELMPTTDRGSISSVEPTGWHSVVYPNVSGGYLYNRCHLIGWQLTGENANRQNLITGTKFLNIEGMLPFENMLADYIKETGNHVMFRVTPVFEGNNLLCTGVLLEAYSVEDDGEGILFNVFCYNSQPGINIDYATGASSLADEEPKDPNQIPENATYIINTSSKKIHRLDSKYAGNLTSNMEYTTLSLEELLKLGYTTCGTCKPS